MATALPPPSAMEEDPSPSDPVAEFQEKLRKAWDLALHPPKIEVGVTPADVVLREGRMRLLHYRCPQGVLKEDRPPVLCVYALINKPYIMDLQPGLSVVETLLSRGLDVFLIDWGTPNELDRDLTLHDYVNGYVGRSVEAVQRETGEAQVHILGYCMGGTFSAMYTALHPENVRTLTLMAAPLDFDTRSSYLNIWAHAPGFDAWKIARTFGLIPPEFFNSAFGMLDPLRTSYLKFKDLLERMDDTPFVENFLRMEKWTNDGIPMAGPTYAEFIDKGYQKNLLIKGEWTLDGDKRRVDLKAIDMPLATIVGLKDNLVPPESTEHVLGYVGSKDTTKFQFPGGHIGLSVSRRAHQELWPRYADWVLARSRGPSKKSAPAAAKAPKARARRRRSK
ncbi:MAG: alpha/beta fold hydrolase [Euryarchaeota archaeon]|nr:alpha/beta fold hydrolase [Euryarchaeota archaeon]MDE1837562.1 alpha/beta fold hydrolase [Euryarchaeota archaeon]MDE1880043.1 alpha/beta fold hydrolase [Euryarchaeota archaeon]MDE2046128.1 alpha/beta fold hydrolase [Thermoplasmata archaeon]